MESLITFMLKILATCILAIIFILNVVISLLLWDKRFLKLEDGHDFIWGL